MKSGRILEFLFGSNAFSPNKIKIQDHRSIMNVETFQSTVKTMKNGTMYNENPQNMEKFGTEERFKHIDQRIDEMESKFLLKIEKWEHKLEKICSLLKQTA